MDSAVLGEECLAASQQPAWDEVELVGRVRDELQEMPPLVDLDAPQQLLANLASVAAGEALVLQAGDCAEDFADCTEDAVRRKIDLLNTLSNVLAAVGGLPVLPVGRIGGQYAKPRSATTERIGDIELPVFRGPSVNEPAFSADARRADPLRMLTAYHAAKQVMQHLDASPGSTGGPSVWTSHEALLLDYEAPMMRHDSSGRAVLATTHWPWIGERTRQLDGAHVALLSGITNPVACKVGPQMSESELVALCQRLDPAREPGRLTLIARLGAVTAGRRLPSLVAAVRRSGHPVIWLCDPMHANTITADNGLKTRMVDEIIREVKACREAVTAAGAILGGLHLEATPDEVSECLDSENDRPGVAGKYTTLCDPRLNPPQAVSVISAWQAPRSQP